MSKITAEQASINVDILLQSNDSDFRFEANSELKDYIKQANKQEKLLELYRELAYYTRPIIIDDKYVELQQKIKELEKL